MYILTPEQKAAKAAYNRIRYANLSPEQRAAKAEQGRRYQSTLEGKAKRAAGARRRYMTPEGRTLSLTAQKRFWAKPGAKRVRDEYWRRRQYGMEAGDFDAMLIAQDGLCAICGDQLITPCVDHDHMTGIIRGLLCRRCNGALGDFGDTVDGLLIAVAYLKAS